MATKGFKFHGAYASRTKATAKRRKVGGFVKRIKVRGQTRYAVITRRK